MLPEDDPLLDILLRVYADSLNKTDGRIKLGVTLQMSGILISGIVITYQDFVLSDAFASLIKEKVEHILAQDQTPEPPPEDAEPLRFIHLRKAHFFMPGQPSFPSQTEGLFWRGRVDRIDGYSLTYISDVAEPGMIQGCASDVG